MHRVVEFFQKVDLRQFLIWCECLLCALLILYIFRKIFRSKKIVVNNGKNGTISISGNALSDAILTIAKQSGFHGKIKLKIKCRRKKLVVNMRVHASAQHNISNISGIIHHRLNEILLKSVGLDVENEVNVTIASLKKVLMFFQAFYLKAKIRRRCVMLTKQVVILVLLLQQTANLRQVVRKQLRT